MTTLTVNDRTKAGKSFLEFAKNLPFVKINEELSINNLSNNIKEEVLFKKIKRSANHAREIAAGTRKGNSLENLLNDL